MNTKSSSSKVAPDSPSRQLLGAMNIRPSPSKVAPDSPSRQLLYELNRLAISDQQQFLSRLDRENEQRENIHREALAAAAAQHERVREGVELERRRLETQIQAERERRDEDARREIEQQRREKAAREIEERKREIERVKAEEEHTRRLAELDKQRRETEDAAKLRRQQQEEDESRRAREADAANQRRLQESQRPPTQPQQLPTPPTIPAVQSTTLAKSPPFQSATIPQASASTSSQPVTTIKDPGLEEEHNRYLAIHKRLKEMRQFMAAEAKKNKTLKDSMGDMRREMKKSVGQLTEGKGANSQSVRKPLQRPTSICFSNN